MTDCLMRPWMPAASRQFHEDHAACRAFPPDGIRSEVDRLLAAHERYMDRECISLYAGTNMPSPRVARCQSSTIGSRPSLGYPGDKYETGLRYGEQIEILAVEILRRIFDCRYVEYRVGSGSLANLYAFMACTKPGDRIMALPDEAAGHVTHHAAGAAGLYGLDVHDVPWDGSAMTVDLEAFEREAHRVEPRLIILGASFAMHPYPVRQVREIADSVGAFVMYDAAHLSGLIAGGAFQQPLAEGAHLMTCSTYKSFGGPAGGLVLTNSPELAERLDRIAYPGLTANFDLGRTAALVMACADILEFGSGYARICIENARALSESLASAGCPVQQGRGGAFTDSHLLAVRAAEYGGGTAAGRLLENANILAGGIGLPGAPVAGDFNGLRLGTQEVTRWGMRPQHMPKVARLMARVLVDHEPPGLVRPDTLNFRAGFQNLHFVRLEE